MQQLAAEHTALIKAKAHELGFFFCGVSKAEFLEEEAPRLEAWLNQNRNGEMQWMENHFDLRLDPTKLMPGAKSIVSVALNYFPKVQQEDKEAPKLSKYAYGKDYHYVIKDKLRELLKFIHKEIGEVGGRAFVDSAPIMDKAWAKKSGIGWQGKNTNIIAKKAGSFFFLGELVLDLPLVADGPIKDYCGTCKRCLDACPTGALHKPYEIDGSKCISYFTIEYRKPLPDQMKGKFENWMFGCDICQDVCPWNKLSKAHSEPSLDPHERLLSMSKDEWEEITEDIFQDIFRKSAVKRTKFEGLKRNIRFLYNEKSLE